MGAAGISNSVAVDVQLGGVLDVTTRSAALPWTLQSGQTLMGNGVIRGNIFTAGGSTLAPGASAIGTLLVTNAGTTVTLGGNTVMEINRSATQTSDRLSAVTNVFGGTLTVNNIGGPLQLNDSFTLFTSVTNRGAFAVTNLPVLTTGLSWNNTLAINGKLTVVVAVNTNPTNITVSASGNTRTLSWPTDHIGWTLQAQTNNATTGLVTNASAWFDVPGSASVNSVNVTIDPTKPAVFYRMKY